MTEPRPSVLICDDSRTYATALRRLLEHDGDIDVVAHCATAEEAIAALPRLRPTLVTMDLELPGMGGLHAVEQIMSRRPVAICVLSSHIGDDTQRAAAALAAGALDAVDKGALDVLDPAGAAAVAFRRRLKVLSRARVIRHPRAILQEANTARRLTNTASVIGICSSTGGPQILSRLLESLPGDYAIPLLVVQHISPGFTDGLAEWLDRIVPLPVRIAEDRTPVSAGVWIAPEGAHLKLDSSGLLLLDSRTVGDLHRPSGDILLESIAATAGRSGVAVVLSGMGRDGAAGAATVKRSGGLAIAQDEESSAVYGMPKAALDAGVTLSLGPDGIAERLRGLRYEPIAVLS
ncbi:MAG: two-component system, chemotaxis family, protein-glutamate methylesterase/glutaminase [Gaiellaceae bacterium]|nr:two-component system, chemotaxis family, protein-glutamate methylesterase/glutaminase [Gaiellaceae bacterium]